MRWARLFDDLDAQAEASERADRDAQTADLRRLEVSRQRLAGRLAAAASAAVTLRVEGCEPVTGVVQQAGADWVLVQATGGAEVLVALGAVSSILDLPAAADPADDRLDARLGLAFVLRRLARDRAAVLVVTRSGESFTGTIDRVGADFLDLAEHAADRPRRPDEVQRV